MGGIGSGGARAIKVIQRDYFTNEVIDVYESIHDAAEDNNCSYSNLVANLKKNGAAIIKTKELKFEVMT